MKTFNLLLILFSTFLFISCSPDDNKLSQNANLGILSIESISFQGKEVTIDWNDVVDADDDIIYYKLYINSILIAETTESINISTLEYNNEYEGRIIATDKKGGISELEFTFNSLKSKILFFPEFYGGFTAYDLITNRVLWKSNTSFIEAHTAYYDKIYSGLNGINALNILSGEILWTSTPSVNYNGEYRNIIADNDNVYAFDSDSNLHCVNRLSGEKLWERSFLDYYAPLTIDDTKVFVCSRNNDHLYAINKVTGGTDWGFRLNSSYKIITNPLITDNTIYFGDYGGIFYALNKNTGEKIWEVDAGQYNSFYASPTIFENAIITGTFRTVYAYYKNDGSIKWIYSPIGGIESSPFIYDNNVYIGTSNNGRGELVCLNAADGNVKWKYDLANKSTSSPIVFEDTVYISDWDKNLYAINATTGVLDWKLQTNEIIIKSPTIVIGNSETIIYPSSHGLKN